MSDVKEIIEALIKFRNERDWEQFHNPKDLAVALNIEAGELLENFLWKSHDEANREKVKEELADVLAYSFLLAEKYGFDIKDILLEKIKKNAEKYPVDKAKGTAKKYNELYDIAFKKNRYFNKKFNLKKNFVIDPDCYNYFDELR